MAPRNIPNPPSQSPGENKVWAYNYNSKKYDAVRSGSSVLNSWPYVDRPSTTTPSQPGGLPAQFYTPPGSGQRERITPSGQGSGRVPSSASSDTDDDDGGKGGNRPAVAPIDWEAIVNSIQVDALQAAKEIYGGMYAIIEGNEEIKKLILDAYVQKWEPARFLSKLRETEWWKTTTDTARQFDINEQLDPATTTKNINQKALSIQEIAMQKGVRLADDVASRLARESLRLGWDDITLANSVGAEIVKMRPTTQVSQGYIGNQIRQTALDFGIRLSETSFNKWTEQILTGKASDQMYKDFLLNQAKTMFPTLGNGFDRGLTFKQMTDPYAEQASRVLEIPTSQIDFTDPKWAAAFTMADDKGNQRQMTYSEWDRYLKTNSAFGFEYTDNAKNQALDLVGRIGRLFGAA